MMKTEDYTLLINKEKEYFNIQKFYLDNEKGIPKQYISNTGAVIEEAAGAEGSWFVSYSTFPKSYYSIYKEYSSKGLIRCKWVNFRNGGAVIGMKYRFSQNGMLIEKEDTEEGYTFTPNQVILYCQEHEIDLLAHDSCIERYADDKKEILLYLIHYTGKYGNRTGRILLLLNGQTGETERVLLGNPGGMNEVIYEKNNPSGTSDGVS